MDMRSLIDLFETVLDEAEYKGRKVTLDKPFRTPGGPRKFSVYVKNDKGKVVKVNFGDPNMEIRRDDPVRRKSFRARHGCDVDPGPKWKPKYWSCRFWETGKSVSELLESDTSDTVVETFFIHPNGWRVPFQGDPNQFIVENPRALAIAPNTLLEDYEEALRGLLSPNTAQGDLSQDDLVRDMALEKGWGICICSGPEISIEIHDEGSLRKIILTLVDERPVENVYYDLGDRIGDFKLDDMQDFLDRGVIPS